MKKIIIPIMAAAVAVLFAACIQKQVQVPPRSAEVVRPEKIENDPAQQELTARPDDVIATSYGELTFPGMWADRVQYEIEENETADVKIHFNGAVDGAQAKLFTLCYGTVPEDGYEMGALLTDGDMLVPVSVVMYPIVPQEDWSEETTNELYALQESVNDLLVQIQSDPDFHK